MQILRLKYETEYKSFIILFRIRMRVMLSWLSFYIFITTSVEFQWTLIYNLYIRLIYLR